MGAAGQPSAERYAIRAGQVFDGQGFRGAGVVVVDAGRVVAVDTVDTVDDVGAVDGAASASGLPVVELGDDVTLLPGLVDPHVHLVFDASPGVVANVRDVTDDELTLRVRDHARTTLAAGVTTVRDLGDRRYVTLPLREEFAREPSAGPELLCAGPPITTPGGHCWFLGGEVAQDGDLADAVAERAARGVDAVKVMVTGGEMTPGSHSGIEQFGADAVRAIVAEARRYVLPVAAHAHSPAGIASALAAGVDTIEHCSFMTVDDVVVDARLVDAIAASGVIVSLTVGIVPTDTPPPPKLLALMPKLMEVIRRLVAAGVTVTLGSDAGIGPPKPHGVLPHCVAALADLTGDNTAALAAATSVGARACGLADRKGRLAAGYDADILAVRGDPGTDIRTLHDVVAVYRAGVQVGGVQSAPAAPRLPA